MSTPTTCASACARSKLASARASARQPVHQDAHMLTTTGFPANAARLTCWPVTGSAPLSLSADPLDAAVGEFAGEALEVAFEPLLRVRTIAAATAPIATRTAITNATFSHRRCD